MYRFSGRLDVVHKDYLSITLLEELKEHPGGAELVLAKRSVVLAKSQ
jgi:hypothetical protein